MWHNTCPPPWMNECPQPHSSVVYYPCAQSTLPLPMALCACFLLITSPFSFSFHQLCSFSISFAMGLCLLLIHASGSCFSTLGHLSFSHLAGDLCLSAPLLNAFSTHSILFISAFVPDQHPWSLLLFQPMGTGQCCFVRFSSKTN